MYEWVRSSWGGGQREQRSSSCLKQRMQGRRPWPDLGTGTVWRRTEAGQDGRVFGKKKRRRTARRQTGAAYRGSRARRRSAWRPWQQGAQERRNRVRRRPGGAGTADPGSGAMDVGDAAPSCSTGKGRAGEVREGKRERERERRGRATAGSHRRGPAWDGADGGHVDWEWLGCGRWKEDLARAPDDEA